MKQKYKPEHVHHHTCTRRQTLKNQTSASLHELPSSDEQASASTGYLVTQPYTGHQQQCLMMLVSLKILHSKLALGFFSWPKSIYYCNLSLTSFTCVKLELRVHFYNDSGEFDGHRGINLGIWSQWLYHGTDD